MGHAVAVYAVAAILLAASAGPVLAHVRDASLLEFEALDEPRSINDFPLLQRVKDYLPPVIVDWLIIESPELDIPHDVQLTLDPHGRWILNWPDGCKETEDEFRQGSRCAPPTPIDCDEQPLHPDCRQSIVCPDSGTNTTQADCPPIDCPPGEILHEDQCVPDPACADEPDERPDHCPGPGGPNCPVAHVVTVYGDCIALRTHALIDTQRFSGSEPTTRNLTIELTAHYANLSIEIGRSGFLVPGWRVELRHHEEARAVCWVPRDNPQQTPNCTPGQGAGASGGNSRYVDDPFNKPTPPGNLTLRLEYLPGVVSTSSQLEIRLYGQPTDP